MKGFAFRLTGSSRDRQNHVIPVTDSGKVIDSPMDTSPPTMFPRAVWLEDDAHGGFVKHRYSLDDGADDSLNTADRSLLRHANGSLGRMSSPVAHNSKAAAILGIPDYKRPSTATMHSRRSNSSASRRDSFWSSHTKPSRSSSTSSSHDRDQTRTHNFRTSYSEHHQGHHYHSVIANISHKPSISPISEHAPSLPAITPSSPFAEGLLPPASPDISPPQSTVSHTTVVRAPDPRPYRPEASGRAIALPTTRPGPFGEAPAPLQADAMSSFGITSQERYDDLQVEPLRIKRPGMSLFPTLNPTDRASSSKAKQVSGVVDDSAWISGLQEVSLKADSNHHELFPPVHNVEHVAVVPPRKSSITQQTFLTHSRSDSRSSISIKVGPADTTEHYRRPQQSPQIGTHRRSTSINSIEHHARAQCAQFYGHRLSGSSSMASKKAPVQTSWFLSGDCTPLASQETKPSVAPSRYSADQPAPTSPVHKAAVRHSAPDGPRSTPIGAHVGSPRLSTGTASLGSQRKRNFSTPFSSAAFAPALSDLESPVLGPHSPSPHMQWPSPPQSKETGSLSSREGDDDAVTPEEFVVVRAAGERELIIPRKCAVRQRLDLTDGEPFVNRLEGPFDPSSAVF